MTSSVERVRTAAVESDGQGHEDAVLRLAIRRLCAAAGFANGRLFLRDAATGRFRVEAALGDPDTPALSRPTRRSMGPDDPLVELLKAGRRPCVLGADRRGGPGTTRLAVPVSGPGTGLLGFALLDHPVDHLAGEPSPDPVSACAELVGAAVLGVLTNRRLAAAHEELTRRHEALRLGGEAERRLSRLVGRPGGLSPLVRACAELTGKAVALFDAQHRLVTSAGPVGEVRIQPVNQILAGARVPRTGEPCEPCEPAVVPARPAAGLLRRHVLTPVLAGDRHFGWLVVMEYPALLTAYDLLVARRGAECAATEFTVQKRVADVAWNARSSLARQLVRGTSTVDDLRGSGEYLGVDIDARRVLVYLTGPGGRFDDPAVFDPAGDERLAAGIRRRLGLDVLTTRGSEGLVLLVESPRGTEAAAVAALVKSAVREVCAAQPGGEGLAAGVSSVAEPSELARAYREAREVAHCIGRFAGGRSPRVLAVDDLGPARLFLANSGAASVRRYVDDVLGPLLTSAAHHATLLLTLRAWFDSGRSVRVSAVELGVHENTVRLRLARVHDLTGLDVLADAGDQLSVQTALLVLRLQGHPALLSPDGTGADHDGRKTA
ncbi:helix-turn-helix domain-containing protein [Streptomyces sp. NPDC047070]|uniref:PucR family transcriptional regulator n=1 Tax=Streptomyces sp. NPDC047070 TaxID=3154923 RepID=UPI003456B507